MSDVNLRDVVNFLEARMVDQVPYELTKLPKDILQVEHRTITLGGGRADGHLELAIDLGFDNPSQTLVVFGNKGEQTDFQDCWRRSHPGKAMPHLHYGAIHPSSPVIKRLTNDGVILDRVISCHTTFWIHVGKRMESLHTKLADCTDYETKFYLLG